MGKVKNSKKQDILAGGLGTAGPPMGPGQCPGGAQRGRSLQEAIWHFKALKVLSPGLKLIFSKSINVSKHY